VKGRTTATASTAGVDAAAVDAVAVVRPFTHGAEAPVQLLLQGMFPRAEIYPVEHHLAHAASAWFASPFEEGVVLTLDRNGDFRCAARWTAGGLRMTLDRELYHPDSPGDLYARLTTLLGFEANAEEHKVQWLSMAGDDRYRELFLEILSPRDTGWPRLDRTFIHGERMSGGGFSGKFYSRLGLREGAAIPEELKAPLAAGLQRALEAVVIEMAGRGENLCLAGGLALNALLVAALERSGRWKNVFVQPAAGNSGTALGGVYHLWHQVFHERERMPLRDLCLGPGYPAEETKRVLENCKLNYRYLPAAGELIETAVRELRGHKIVAWMHGRMEFGPRALGNRSILASPLNPRSAEHLNLYIKHREPFRKFALSVPEEAAGAYFEAGPNARFLATVGRVRPEHRKLFGNAILGEDQVRVHSVHREENPLFWELLQATGRATGLPVLYNTSFNLPGDPLVCTPRDAVRSFYSSGIDVLFAGNFYVTK